MFPIISDQTMSKDFQTIGLVASYQMMRQGLGNITPDPEYRRFVGDPTQPVLALESLFAEQALPPDSGLDSIAFFSLCKGLYLPLSECTPRVAQLFGIGWQSVAMDNQALVEQFLTKDLGLTLSDKIAYLMGDPWAG